MQRLGLTEADFAPIKQAVVVENDLDKAASTVTEQMLAIGVVGEPADLISRLEPLVSAGVQHLSFGPDRKSVGQGIHRARSTVAAHA
jgi:hypothetical protein